MPAASSSGVAALRRPRALPRSELAPLDPALAAWIAAVPTAVVTIAAALLLGPQLGDWLFPTPTARFWPSLAYAVRPEPTEQARYLIALTAPLVLSGLTLLLARRASRGLAASGAALAMGAETLAMLVVLACFVAQRLQAPQNYDGDRTPVVYFTGRSIAVALAIGAVVVLAARAPRVRERFASVTAESLGRRIGAALVAVVAVGIAVLPAIHTDASIGGTNEAVAYHLAFTYDETMAVLDGRSPLGDFAAQYSSLWPYVLAGAMTVVGSSLAAFTGLLTALTSATLLAAYDVLRRLTRSSVAALLLFLPLLGMFGLRLHGPAVDRFSLMNYFGVMPLRYAGPFLLAWLTARHLDGARPRAIWPLFLAGGLVAINNPDFGIAAAGATVAALLWTQARPTRSRLRRSALEALAGAGAAAALVATLVVARTGAAPDVSLMFTYARLFAVEGFGMVPVRPLFGVDVVVFLTYVATIGVATVRALRRDPDRLLTGLLAWSGIFGLGAGAYYVGHSLSELLVYMLPAWGFAVTLLALTAIRAIASAQRRPRPGEVACLVGLGLLACSLAQTPLPWQQLDRIASDNEPILAHPLGEEVVAQYARRGEPVLILGMLGHRMAVNLGLDDVDVVTGRSVLTVEQLDSALATLHARGGEKVFVNPDVVFPGLIEALERTYGYRAEGPSHMELWQPR